MKSQPNLVPGHERCKPDSTETSRIRERQARRGLKQRRDRSVVAMVATDDRAGLNCPSALLPTHLKTAPERGSVRAPIEGSDMKKLALVLVLGFLTIAAAAPTDSGPL